MVNTNSVTKMLNTDIYISVMFDECVWYQLSKHNSATETYVKTVKMTSAVSNRSALFSTCRIWQCFTDGENKRRMNKWINDCGTWCVMNCHYVITMWVEFWNERGMQNSREICVQQNSVIWRTCTPEICRHVWGKTANPHLKKLSTERFWCWVRSSDVCWLSGINVRDSWN